ncbi:MAG: aminoacyl--tRNA ligase-related protein [bacterium]|nr:aminoacyl--tRNA ligase-related protein [bacterium]
MRVTRSFSKTRKEKPSGATTISHELLVRGGFIDQELAGVFTMLPYGWNVLTKIEQIVREAMNKAGGQELLMTNLQAKDHWETTGRWKSIDVLFKVPSQHGREYALSPTAEDVITPIAKERIKSYRDLPLAAYQIQTKFRDEARAKSGIIRGREFRMKDLYSFHADQADLERYYNSMIPVYLQVYKRCGIDAKVVEASGGDFTKQNSIEFMAISDAGEDTIVYCAECTFAQNKEIAKLGEQHPCPDCATQLKTAKAMEIGNIFKLGTKFSEAFGATFVDAQGKQQPIIMASYGIGTTRLVGAIIEVHHDERGMIWPESVAPFGVHLVGINLDNDAVKKACEQLYGSLEQAGVEVLFDDRESASAGEKLSDADLIGIPHRVVISKKTLAGDTVEYKKRSESEPTMLSQAELLKKIIGRGDYAGPRSQRDI